MSAVKASGGRTLVFRKAQLAFEAAIVVALIGSTVVSGELCRVSAIICPVPISVAAPALF